MRVPLGCQIPNSEYMKRIKCIFIKSPKKLKSAIFFSFCSSLNQYFPHILYVASKNLIVLYLCIKYKFLLRVAEIDDLWILFQLNAIEKTGSILSVENPLSRILKFLSKGSHIRFFTCSLSDKWEIWCWHGNRVHIFWLFTSTAQLKKCKMITQYNTKSAQKFRKLFYIHTNSKLQ
jgi:hypothetical protein